MNAEQAIPSLAERLSLILLICGIGLVFLGFSSSWKGQQGLMQPEAKQLLSYTGTLQTVDFISSSHEPSVVELILYQKHKGLRRAYFNYGLHSWKERLKPYKNKEITIFLTKVGQVWRVMVGAETIISGGEVEKVFLKYKKGQQSFALKMEYVGFAFIIFWFLFLKRRYPILRR
ncbi:MAG: hypothetical protein R8M46_00415 [Ghiorsea sp.]